ncbi:MAG: 4-phosphoerythronate dehydrogenase [Bacteroidales bacterium]
MNNRSGLSLVIDEAIPYIRGVPEQAAAVSYLHGRSIGPGEIENADALIIRTRTICNANLLRGSRVSFIATATIGFDHIDTDYCRKHGITWTSAPGCNSGSVMQYMTASLLHLCIKHRLEPSEATLGIVGAGHVGSKVATAAKAIGMKVLLNDPPRQRREKYHGYTRLGQLLGESDIVTLHVPLTMQGRDATFHLAGREFIASMKRGAFLINTSRGGITEEEEVKKALWSGQLRGYIADVWSGEPAADTELIAMAEIATPHIAGYSADGKLNGTRIALQALSNHFSVPLTLPDDSILPVPEQKDLPVPQNIDGITEALHHLIRVTYNVESESSLFKSNPDEFEELRNNYPIRREFSAYTIKGMHPAVSVARRLGFNTIR